jgi:hypothetical protein
VPQTGPAGATNADEALTAANGVDPWPRLASLYLRLCAWHNPASEAAALDHERCAALSNWAAIRPGSGKEPKVCRQPLELQARLGTSASAMGAAHA